MSTTGLWIVTGIEGLLILGLGAFGWMASQGLTRIVVKTGKELGDKIAEVSDEIPKIVENVIEKGGDATGKGLEMVSNPGGVSADARLARDDEANLPTSAEATLIKGGRKQTKGNKPKKIRKPRTKKNITKVGNKMYMNFSL